MRGPVSRQSRIPIGIATTPAAMPDGPPSRKGPLCSVLSPLPALYFYCKDPRRPTRRNRFRKTVPLSASHSPWSVCALSLYEYNPPLKLLVSEGLFFCLSLMTNAIDCAKISHKSYPRINYSYGRMRFKRHGAQVCAQTDGVP